MTLDEFQVLVRQLSGDELCSIAASRQQPMEAIKAQVAKATGIAVAEQRLLSEGSELRVSLEDAKKGKDCWGYIHSYITA